VTPPGHGASTPVEELAAAGYLPDIRWREAMSGVPRSHFIPDTIWINDADGRLSPVNRGDPRWAAGVDADEPVVTQVDDGTPAERDGRGRIATSSASQPRMVARMLCELGAEPGHRVLEIGTATGYNCALLCHGLGDEAVASVEIDAELAAAARDNLRTLGYAPNLVVGDGTLGHPAGAPYDRVLSTVAAKRVPGAWVAQLRPGGVIVTPWGSDFGGHWLLRLEADASGRAHGRIVGEAAFMWLRDQRSHTGTWSDHIDFDAPLRAAATALDPRVVIAEEGGGLAVALGTLVPDLYRVVAWERDARGRRAPSGACTVWVYDARGSWAAVDYAPDTAAFPVGAHGPRHLWGEVEAAFTAWEAAGRPDRDRLGITVTAEGTQHMWVDGPDQRLPREGGGAASAA
jgi:protein-L-isoaspartate(D-aspartate) O-methyltransferase